MAAPSPVCHTAALAKTRYLGKTEKHKCPLSPTSAEVIPKLNVIPTYMVTPNGLFFHGLPESLHPLILSLSQLFSELKDSQLGILW